MVSELGYKLCPEENVLSRMMIAIDDNPQHEIILRITGDDILIDPDYLMETVNNFKINNSDYTDAKNLPSGTEVEVLVKTFFLLLMTILLILQGLNILRITIKK